MNEPMVAYAAGLFDGEGYVTIGHTCGVRKSGQSWDHWYVRIGIKMTNLRALEWMKENFGGYINRAHGNHLSKKDLYTWNLVERDKVTEFCNALIPVCLIKSEQLVLALEYHQNFRKVSGDASYKDEEYARRDSVRVRLRAVNGG